MGPDRVMPTDKEATRTPKTPNSKEPGQGCPQGWGRLVLGEPCCRSGSSHHSTGKVARDSTFNWDRKISRH